eukprot:498085-Hanusia_phi.AAC.1
MARRREEGYGKEEGGGYGKEQDEGREAGKKEGEHVLFDIRGWKGSRHEDAAGEEALAASVHILAAVMRENSSIVEVAEGQLTSERPELTRLQAMAEQRDPNVLHLMGEMLAHPSMGEASDKGKQDMGGRGTGMECLE